jgi:hypothetical protein
VLTSLDEAVESVNHNEDEFLKEGAEDYSMIYEPK